MEDKQKKYLDKVVEFLERGTRMDYDKETVYYPYSSDLFFFFTPFPSFTFFYKYCKNVYGLTSQEIGYVWNQYKDIILDKINNGK